MSNDKQPVQAGQVINQEMLVTGILTSVKPLIQVVLADLVNDPNLRKIVIASMLSVINDKEFRSSLKALIIEILRDENVRRELRDFLRDVGNPLRLLLPP
ncbi:hypothetical protein [Vulcanisaeta distributa]|uniref:Uncharacterized protein n=1 Tax=Vulcanisaeta distributa (strain DSM 14429 / JCM 11212 / NBRC 100878 / IC-017) TaxID=572478 RepID=E1QV59_VULDI|nr:hypothetical protein [Vulcanisaeta distributa]ADN51250.1 hypothetical protein Vdis_1878 [Vulcanisaeta distributa DSM 14429]